MPIDISAIPAERLALLDTTTLYGGSHRGGEPDCKHCARELLMEVVTGQHADATPPGCTVLMAVLPALNDGPWRNDEHRTEVMRPYLRRMLLLDPANDEQRVYAIIDLVYRSTLPDICDALKFDKLGWVLRNLAPIVDRKTSLAVRDVLAARVVRAILDAYAALDVRALDVLDVRAALAALDVLDVRAARTESWERVVRQILDRICEVP